MTLDVEAARAAVQTIADAMGLDSVEEAAEGILAIVNENMAGALRLVSVQRGHDPRDFALVAYGGAGPLHANAVAEADGLVPGDRAARARACSARSATSSPTSATSSRRRTSACSREAEPATRSRGILDELGGRARRVARRARASRTTRGTITYVADMRYHGQGYEIPVAIDPDEVRAGGLGDLEERFNALHEQLYGFRMPGTASRDRQPARGRLRRACRSPSCRSASAAGADASGAVVDEHDVVFDGRAACDEDLRPREAASRGIAIRRARRS